MTHKKTYIFDLDGTICSEEKTFERSMAVPNLDLIDKINNLYQNNTIIIYSARSWSEYAMTTFWLDLYSVKYDILILGKPLGDVWVDDRSMTPEEFLNGKET